VCEHVLSIDQFRPILIAGLETSVIVEVPASPIAVGADAGEVERPQPDR
jgi:hypothetical protein